MYSKNSRVQRKSQLSPSLVFIQSLFHTLSLSLSLSLFLSLPPSLPPSRSLSSMDHQGSVRIERGYKKWKKSNSLSRKANQWMLKALCSTKSICRKASQWSSKQALDNDEVTDHWGERDATSSKVVALVLPDFDRILTVFDRISKRVSRQGPFQNRTSVL